MLAAVGCCMLVILGAVRSAPVNPQPHIPDVKEGTDPTNVCIKLQVRPYQAKKLQVRVILSTRSLNQIIIFSLQFLSLLFCRFPLDSKTFII